MKIKIFIVPLLILTLGRCKAQEIQWPKFAEIKTTKAIRIWLDNGNPISYVINFDNDSLTLTIYTHNTRNDLLIKKNLLLSDTVTYKYFESLHVFELRDCETYKDYSCTGLDGVTMKIEFMLNGQNVAFEYWSPLDQKKSHLGQRLNAIKEKIDRDFEIPFHIRDFVAKLKKGSYGNYGESMITK